MEAVRVYGSKAAPGKVCMIERYVPGNKRIDFANSLLYKELVKLVCFLLFCPIPYSVRKYEFPCVYLSITSEKITLLVKMQE
jgi:hypothetical protein